jgi:hypothetical protein
MIKIKIPIWSDDNKTKLFNKGDIINIYGKLGNNQDSFYFVIVDGNRIKLGNHQIEVIDGCNNADGYFVQILGHKDYGTLSNIKT